MKEGITDWQACDKILKFLVDNPDRPYDEHKLKAALFPEFALDFVQQFIKQIKDYPLSHPIFTEHKYADGGIKATSFTEIFLEQGGFDALHKKEKANKERGEKLAIMNYEKIMLELEDVRDKMLELPKTKTEAKNARYWSIAASVATVLTWILLLLQWKCNKSG